MERRMLLPTEGMEAFARLRSLKLGLLKLGSLRSWNQCENESSTLVASRDFQAIVADL